MIKIDIIDGCGRRIIRADLQPCIHIVFAIFHGSDHIDVPVHALQCKGRKGYAQRIIFHAHVFHAQFAGTDIMILFHDLGHDLLVRIETDLRTVEFIGTAQHIALRHDLHIACLIDLIKIAIDKIADII